ncbi:Uncharacterized mitochondrial protein AtMg01250, partial [Linum perenne]
MRKFRFRERWIYWISQCFGSSRLTILLNGQPVDYFPPSRGLRQGDPLSPLLFALVSERLTLIIQKALSEENIIGLQLNDEGPVITHLMFADDTYMFLKVSDPDISDIIDLFELYQQYSGQKINLTKSVVTFSKGTSEANKLLWSNMLGASISNNQDIYLGLP